MLQEVKTIDWEEFVDNYGLVKNHIDEHASYNNCMFETFGEELAYIVSLSNNEESKKFVWTIIDGENEETWIIPGYHYVNRYGYLVTEKPWETEDIQVNDNEMISNIDAKISCIDFYKGYDVIVSENEVSDFFTKNYDDTFKDEMTVGRAKYLAIEYYETFVNVELTTEMQEDIYDYYNNLK
jgi:hypothetical protein